VAGFFISASGVRSGVRFLPVSSPAKASPLGAMRRREMASLIEQLQREALDPSTSITNLLRKTKLAAMKLGREDAARWVEECARPGGGPAPVEAETWPSPATARGR